MKPETLNAYAALADAIMKDDSCNQTMVIAKIPSHVLYVQCGPVDENEWTLPSDEILSRWSKPAFSALQQKIASLKKRDAEIAAQQQQAAQQGATG